MRHLATRLSCKIFGNLSTNFGQRSCFRCRMISRDFSGHFVWDNAQLAISCVVTRQHKRCIKNAPSLACYYFDVHRQILKTAGRRNADILTNWLQILFSTEHFSCVYGGHARDATLGLYRWETTEGKAWQELVALMGANGVISINFQLEISRKRMTSRTDRPSRDHTSTAAAAVTDLLNV